MRLDKALGLLGYTRKQAKALIQKGRVRIGDMLVKDASERIDQDAALFVDGQPQSLQSQLHFMIHKPQGVLTATEDARCATVMDLIPESVRRKGLGPVGRLDKDVTGLVLMTTDGQLAHRLISPKWTIEKVYAAQVEGALDSGDIARMAEGIALSDFTAKPARLVILSSGERSLAEIAVTEGKYHQVKRMFAAIGHPVIALERISIAKVSLDPALAPGESRALTDGEIESLYQAVGMTRER